MCVVPVGFSMWCLLVSLCCLEMNIRYIYVGISVVSVGVRVCVGFLRTSVVSVSTSAVLTGQCPGVCGFVWYYGGMNDGQPTLARETG